MSTITWTGAAGDNNYNNPANWNPQQVPGAGDTASLPKGALAQIGFGVNDTLGNLKTVAGATLAITSNGTLTLGTASIAHNTVSNGGTISLQATNYNSQLIFASAATTLTGGGTIMMNDDGNNAIYGAVAADILVNTNNLIEGGGQLGAGQLKLTNGAAGVINANAAGTQLILNTGTNTVTNSGLIEAGAGAGLQIQNTRIDSSSGGTIAAVGANIQLNGAHPCRRHRLVQRHVRRHGGFRPIGDLGRDHPDRHQQRPDRHHTQRLADLARHHHQYRRRSRCRRATTIAASSSGPATGATGTVTLTGKGVVTMNDDGNNYINASQSGDTLVNLNETITGAGSIGGGTLTLINKSTINASGPTTALVINTDGATVTNSGLLESTNAGGLTIYNTAVTNSGTIGAFGGNVDLQGASITGGVLASSGTGVEYSSFGQTGTLTNVTSTGQLEATSNGTLVFNGTLTNQGTVSILGTNYNTDFVVGSAKLTLTGGGTVLLGDNGNSRLYGASAANVLDNVNNLIEGSGQLGTAQLTLINEAGGTIDATGVNQALIINTVGEILTNHALIESTGKRRPGRAEHANRRHQRRHASGPWRRHHAEWFDHRWRPHQDHRRQRHTGEFRADRRV